jgi:hypothetical protein
MISLIVICEPATLHELLKGRSHEMDLAFDDMYG